MRTNIKQSGNRRVKIHYSYKKFLRKPLISILLFVSLSFFIILALSPRSNNPSSPVFLDRNNQVLFSQLSEGKFRYPQKIFDLPVFLPKLLVAAEDENFYSHFGLDLKGLARALYLNLKSGKIVAGGSTITQQVAHQILFSQKIGSKKFIEKTVESIYAIFLDALWSKEKILEEYFNRMYFGRLAYGVEAAAQQYFGKSSLQLDLAEGSALLSLLNLPSLSDPRNNLYILKKRQNYILDRGISTGIITSDNASAAYLEPLHFVNTPPASPINECLQKYLVDETVKILTSQNLDSNNLSGLKIKTTLDRDLLRESTRILSERLEEITVTHRVGNAAAVAIKPESGQILSYTCNVSASSKDAAIDLIQAPRQPGSAIKPITYLTALDQGFTLSSVLHDSLQTFYTHDGKAFVPEDYDQRERGLVSLRQALASSLNIPAVELLNEIGLDSFFSTANVLGIKSFIDTHRYDLAITLGGGEVTLLELTFAYATLANQLNQVDLFVIDEISRDNEPIYQHKSIRNANILGKNSSQLSFLMADVLSDNQARQFSFPEVNPLVTSRKTAAKTGTTQDFKDSLTLGYNPSIAVGVWVGNTDYTPMLGISGVQGAATIWHDLMEMYLKNGYIGWYEKPDRVIQQKICMNPGCSNIKNELFIAGTEPSSGQIPTFPTRSKDLPPIKIIYPYQGQTFQFNQADDLSGFQQIIFKAKVTSGSSVEWILNSKSLGKTEVIDGNAKYIWTAQVGQQELRIVDLRDSADVIDFRVVDVINQ